VPGRSSNGDRLLQLAAVLAVGASAVWPAAAAVRAGRACRPRNCSGVRRAWRPTGAAPGVALDAVLVHGGAGAMRPNAQRAPWPRAPVPIVGVTALRAGAMRRWRWRGW
jgi:RHH-type proline utilization regulon transcriptional repressor/proline dehydrogenase/delta 1-pyrroline-5-carboxylate dehydrogenase